MTTTSENTAADIGLALRLFEKDLITDSANLVDKIWSGHSTDGYAAVQQFFKRKQVAGSPRLLNLAFALKPLKYGDQIMKQCCHAMIRHIVSGFKVQVMLEAEVTSFLCPQKPVTKDSYQWAIFGAGKPITNPVEQTNLKIVPGRGMSFLIQADFGETSYLVARDPTDNRVGDTFKDHYGKFTTYREEAEKASMVLEPIDGGAQWRIRAKYWATTWLRPDEGAKVRKDNYQWASFTTHGNSVPPLTIGPYLAIPNPR